MPAPHPLEGASFEAQSSLGARWWCGCARKMRLPRNPTLLEIRAAVLCAQVGVASLADVPVAWLAAQKTRCDGIYLLGAFTPSPLGLQVSRAKLGIDRVSPKDEPAEVAAAAAACSPFSALDFCVAPDLGGDAALKAFKARANGVGLKVLVDFIPNHTACDCPWVSGRPGWYISVPEEKGRADPSRYFAAATSGGGGSAPGSAYLAYGRDLYSREGWSDTAQLNFFHPEVRATLRAVLVSLAADGLCDGVRVQCAMLQLNDVFARTWGRGPELLPSYGVPAQPRRAAAGDVVPAAASSPPAMVKAVAPDEEEWWPATLAAVKTVCSDFTVIAEVYWDLEARLQNMGFDFTYDKVLYDRLVAGNVDGITHTLRGPLDFQRRCARFVENHEEVRAVVAFKGVERSLACAAAALLAPGLRLLHHGQEEGRAVHHSSHRGPRRVPEAAHPRTAFFYQRLGTVLALPVVQDGVWLLGMATAGPALGAGVDAVTAGLLASPGEAPSLGSAAAPGAAPATGELTSDAYRGTGGGDADSHRNLLVYWYAAPAHGLASHAGPASTSFSTLQSSSTLNLGPDALIGRVTPPSVTGHLPSTSQEVGALLGQGRHGSVPSSASAAAGTGGGEVRVTSGASALEPVTVAGELPRHTPSTATTASSEVLSDVTSPPALPAAVAAPPPTMAGGGGSGSSSVVSGTSTSTSGKLAPEFRGVVVGLVKTDVPPLPQQPEAATLVPAATMPATPAPTWVCVVINMSPLPARGFVHASRFDAVAEAHPDTAAAAKLMASRFAGGSNSGGGAIGSGEAALSATASNVAALPVSASASGGGSSTLPGSPSPPGAPCGDADVFAGVDMLGRGPPVLFLQGPCAKGPVGFPVSLQPWDVRTYAVSHLTSLRPTP